MKPLSEYFANKLQLYLEKTISEEGADMGNLQLFNPRTQTLSIIAQKGFKEDFLNHFALVPAFGTSACGRAIGVGTTIVFRDVQKDCSDPIFQQVAAAAGYRAVKSVPIFSDEDEPLGVISIHFRNPQTGWLWNAPDTIDELRVVLKELQHDFLRSLDAGQISFRSLNSK